MTPDEASRLAQLESEVGHLADSGYSHDTQETRGFLGRLGQGIANIPGEMMATIPETLGGLGRMVGLGPEQAKPFPRQTPGYAPLDQPQGAGELVGDVVPMIASQVPTLIGPQAGGTLIARAAGAGPKLARILGAVGTGTLSGIRHSGQEAGIQSGEFGLGQMAAEMIPGGTIPKTLARVAAQAAVPLLGQAARGNNPLSKEGLVQAGVQAAMQGVHDVPQLVTARRLMRATPQQQIRPGLAAELGRSVESDVAATAPRESTGLPDNEEALFSTLFGNEQPTAPAETGGRRLISGARVTPMTRAQYQESMGRRPVPAPADDLGTVVEGEGDVMGLMRKAETGPRVVSTAIRLPDGGHVTGQSWDAGHPTMLMEALDKGLDPTSYPEHLGFIVQDANGVKRFASRVEAGEIARQSGQARALKEGGELTSEHLRGEIPTETQAVPSSPAKRTGTGDTLYTDLRPLIRAGVGGAAGYMIGDTEEERTRNAIIGGAGALVGPTVGRKLIGAARTLKPTLEAAARKESGVTGDMSPSLLGKAVLGAEKYLNVGRKGETVLAVEKGKGTLSDIQSRVSTVLQKNEGAFREAWSDPAHRAVGEKFLASPGGPADVASLDAASVPQAMKDWLKAARSAKREAQPILAEAEPSNSARRKLIQATQGSWQTNVYQIDADPKSWRLNEALVPKVVSEMKAGPLRDFDESTIEANLRQHLNERVKGTDQHLAKGTGSRIDQTLYEHLMDLTPKQWEFVDAMSADPRMPRGAGSVLSKFFADKSIDPSGQTFMKALAGNKALSDAERQLFREIGEKRVITQNYRDLLGQIKDPAQRELYSLNKLFGNIAQAKTISGIADTALESGAKLAYTADTSGTKVVPSAKAWEQAKADALAKGDRALFDELQGYVQLPDSASLGKLSQAYVPRDVVNALNEIQSTMGSVARFFAKANAVTKEVATVWNPSTQIRQAAQTPFFMLAARVSPAQIVNAIKQVAADTRVGKAIGSPGSMVSELHQQHILGANYSEAELNAFAKKLASGNTGNPIARGFKAVRGAVQGLYGIPDDLVRAAAYLSHKPRFLIEAAKKGISGPEAEKYARDAATMFVNDRTMNYGQVAKAVKIARQIPVISPFASYSSEMVRLTKNLLKDVATGSPSDKLWATTALAALYAFPTALASWAKNKFLSPDDQKEWEKTEEMMPQSQRGQLKLVTGKNKKGSFKYVGLNPWMPAGDMVTMIQNATKGDWESFAATQPFFGWQKSPMASAIVDATIKDEHSFTHQKIDTAGKKIGRFAEAFTPSLTPGVGFAGKKLQRAFTRNDDGTRGQVDPRTGNEITPGTALASLAGYNQQVANPTLLRKRVQMEADRKLGDATREMRSILRSGAPSTQKKEAQRKFLARRTEIQKEAKRLLRK